MLNIVYCRYPISQHKTCLHAVKKMYELVPKRSELIDPEGMTVCHTCLCGKWRSNRDKTEIIHACDEDYASKGD